MALMTGRVKSVTAVSILPLMTRAAMMFTCSSNHVYSNYTAFLEGKHYYEVTIESSDSVATEPPVAQIGWADALFVANCSKGIGTGDDEHSWSYDGARQKKWHKRSSEPYGKKWQRGDVIGCCLNIEKREVGKSKQPHFF